MTTQQEHLDALERDCPRVQSACPDGDGLCAHRVTGRAVTISDPPRVTYSGWGYCAWDPSTGRWDTVVLYPVAPVETTGGTSPLPVIVVIAILWTVARARRPVQE